MPDGHTSLSLWGTGKVMREFMWSGDMADACIFIMENVDFKDVSSDNGSEIKNTHINIGTGKEIMINDLALLVKQSIGFEGMIEFDASKPDGTPRKLLDVSKLEQLGWKYKVELENGIMEVYRHYKSL
jgi:GDP-L-fucose synthase